MKPDIDYAAIAARFDHILETRGLHAGLGEAGGKVCVEAAICEAMERPHSDDPDCVSAAVRSYKITMNDASWPSPEARARGLRDLGIAQLGSKGVVDDHVFASRLALRTIRELLPALGRQLRCWPEACNVRMEQAECLVDAVCAAHAAAHAAAAYAAADATDTHYLILSTTIALDILRELGSPGVAFL